MTKNKKEAFNKKGNDNKVFMYVGIAIALIIGVAAYISLAGNDNTPIANNSGGNGQQVQEVTITPTVTNDKVIIKKSELEQNKILKFEYAAQQVTLKSGAKVAFPLMAYVTPSGKLVTAVRMCEPCNGLSFSIVNGNILNCNTCGTQWDLETGQWNGVGAQGCGAYQPEPFTNTVNGDNIEINIADFKNWVPRA